MSIRSKVLGAVSVLIGACGASGDSTVSATDGRLDGVWRLAATEVVGPDGERYPGQAHESLLMFSGGYYSMNLAGGTAPAPYSAEQLRPTDAEKASRYSTLIVNAGRFELSETELTIRPDFALVPEYVGGLGEFAFVLSGDTLDLEWHTIESADGTPDPATAAGVRFGYKWIRD